MTARKRPERIQFVVMRAGSVPKDVGVLVPRHDVDRIRMRERGFKTGVVLSAMLSRARENWFNRKAHVFGRLVAENIERFEGCDPHSVLKTLQAEANVGCDEMMVDAPTVWQRITEAVARQAGENVRAAMQIIGTFLGGVRLPMSVPRSLAFDSMDESEFREVMQRLYRHIAATDWHALDPGQIEQMVDLWREPE